MFEDLLRNTNIVSVISEELDPATGAGKVVVRVLEETPWIGLMSAMIKAVHGDEYFGLEAHKAFYAEKAGDALVMRFAWILVYWGDPEPGNVRAKLTPILTRRVATPPPFALGKAAPKGGNAGVAAARAAPAQPRSAPSAPPPQEEDEDADEGGRISLKRREGGVHRVQFVRKTDDGKGEVYSIPLPHIRGPMFSRNTNPNEVHKFVDRNNGRFRAVVQGIGDSDFQPSREGL